MSMTSWIHEATVQLDSFSSDDQSGSFRFCGLQKVISTYVGADVLATMQQVEASVASGLHAAGFVSYEAGAAFNPELPIAPASDLPLVWFGVFKERLPYQPDKIDDKERYEISAPMLETSRESYSKAISTIKEAIAVGKTYQVNLTTRANFNFQGNPFSLYNKMGSNQKSSYCAYIDTGEHQILSASPELFFALKDGTITMKPMKGTAKRLPNGADDLLQRRQLAANEKERAENLMIVDLVRNDLARIAQTGSVTVGRLFQVETYPTVHQMTSTVSALLKPDTSMCQIFAALFPCGSVTGAPKRQTMAIINQLEESPRGVYCGAIGYLSPDNEATFSVAIRTAVIDKSTGKAEMGIGSGITWDSQAESEYEECLLKSQFLTRDKEKFSLIESIRHDSNGYLLLKRHLERLGLSADYFGIPLDMAAVHKELDDLGKQLHGVHKVRLLLTTDGRFSLEAQEVVNNGSDIMATVAISNQRPSPDDPFLYHKTTNRQFYDLERKIHPDCYDVIFFNSNGQLTEGSYNNIVLLLDGKLLTPSLNCGVLPGVMREELLEVGAIEEATLSLADVKEAEKIWLINSVRGWRECRLISEHSGSN